MDDPTISVGLKFADFLEHHIKEGGDVDSIMKEKEFTEFKKAIQDGRLKSASSPSYFIMTINMNSPKKGVTEKRRRFVSILMRSAFVSSIIFCQERPGYFEQKVVPEYDKSNGYDYVTNGKESAVIWRKEDFDKETKGFEPTDTWIIKVRDRLPDASELLSRIAMVKLTPKKSSERAVLAVSWHGPHKVKDDIKKAEFKSLNTFLAKVIEEKGISSYIIGGDFNLDTLDVELAEDLKDMAVASYELSPRQTTQQQKSSKYIPFKDNFLCYPFKKLRVSHTRPLLFEDEETTTSDLTIDDQKKVEKEMATANPTDMLDHDPIIGVLQFLTAPTAVKNLSKDFEKAKIADSERH